MTVSHTPPSEMRRMGLAFTSQSLKVPTTLSETALGAQVRNTAFVSFPSENRCAPKNS